MIDIKYVLDLVHPSVLKDLDVQILYHVHLVLAIPFTKNKQKCKAI